MISILSRASINLQLLSLLSLITITLYSSPTIITVVDASQLTLTRYGRSASCNGTATSAATHGLDSCIFGLEGRTSARYSCNATHAKMLVYPTTTDCTGRFYLTEPKLDECLKVISTSLKFVCSAGRVFGGGIVVTVMMLMMMAIF